MISLRNTLGLLAVALVASGCSNISFERGPYAIRALEVVYSVQEDVTFLSWRLRGDAKLDRVDFELWTAGDYLPIVLAEAPFPAEPYECGPHWCFQYQVDGRYELPRDSSPLRSVHVDEGVFMGPGERFRTVETTFDFDPIALGHNEEIEPNRFDWFAENGVQLRRSYEWQFTKWLGPGCVEPAEVEWNPMTEPVSVAHEWTDLAVADSGICFVMRPDRADASGAYLARYLAPSAETSWESQKYVPPKVEAPIVWGLVLDLEVPNETRCRQVKSQLIDAVERAINARGDSQKLGIYTPLDPDSGDELGGCDQAAVRDYPLEQMLRDAQTARAENQPQDLRVLWIFANNIELPPPQRVLDQLELLGLAILLSEANDADAIPDEGLPFDPEDEELIGMGTRGFTWAIGSNVFMEMFPWNLTTPWRPVEDQTLLADIKSAARQTLPFATMLHTPETEVEIELPASADTRPLHFKVCDATPLPIQEIGVEPGNPAYLPTEPAPWPEFDDYSPFYRVAMEEQLLVPAAAYSRRSQEVVVEVCTAFCTGGFRTRGGDEHFDWLQTSACQWQQ